MGTHVLHLPFSLHRPPSLKPTPLVLRTATVPPRAPSPFVVAPLRPAPPPLKESSTFLCKGSRYFNAEIYVGEDEPVDEMIARFRREVFRAGVFDEVRRRRFYENAREKKKRKAREAARRNRRARRRLGPMSESMEDYQEDYGEEDFLEDGNWQMPENETL